MSALTLSTGNAFTYDNICEDFRTTCPSWITNEYYSPNYDIRDFSRTFHNLMPKIDWRTFEMLQDIWCDIFPDNIPVEIIWKIISGMTMWELRGLFPKLLMNLQHKLLTNGCSYMRDITISVGNEEVAENGVNYHLNMERLCGSYPTSNLEELLELFFFQSVKPEDLTLTYMRENKHRLRQKMSNELYSTIHKTIDMPSTCELDDKYIKKCRENLQDYIDFRRFLDYPQSIKDDRTYCNKHRTSKKIGSWVKRGLSLKYSRGEKYCNMWSRGSWRGWGYTNGVYRMGCNCAECRVSGIEYGGNFYRNLPFDLIEFLTTKETTKEELHMFCVENDIEYESRGVYKAYKYPKSFSKKKYIKWIIKNYE